MREKPTYKELMEQVSFLQGRVKQMEQLLQKNQEKVQDLKTSFLSSVSHELRTPMNAILGFSSLMIDKNLSHDKRVEYMEHINQNSNSLLNLVDSMIDVSLLQINELKVKSERTDLHKLLHQIYSYCNIEKHKMGKNHLVLLLNKESRDEELYIYTDSFRLNQVLYNFLNNALKFTSKGLVEFGYKIHSKNPSLEFYVKDSGKGVLYRKAQTIFEKFEKLEDSGVNRGGLGLGLTLARGLIELLGGKVWFETNEFNGTTFRFTIDCMDHEKNDSENSQLKKLNTVFF